VKQQSPVPLKQQPEGVHAPTVTSFFNSSMFLNFPEELT